MWPASAGGALSTVLEEEERVACAVRGKKTFIAIAVNQRSAPSLRLDGRGCLYGDFR